MEIERELTDEDIPLSKYSKPAKTEFFPGEMKNVENNKFEISTMTFFVGNTFKWPEKNIKSGTESLT